MEKRNLKEMTESSYVEENFVLELVGTKRLTEIIEKYMWILNQIYTNW